MTVLDARRLPSRSTLQTDVCIVGAGAAGLTLAGALGSSAREVCVLEAGGLEPEEDTQALYDVECVGHPVRENYMARARYYGGTCNLWAGRAMKLAPADVDGRPWLDEPGWPIRYAEFEPYYAEAARILRLPKVRDAEPLQGTSEDEHTLFGDGALVPNVALWAKKPLRFGRRYRGAFRGPHCRLLLHANATEVVLDEAGRRVESLRATSLDGHQIEVRARVFVLAAGGLENARILLCSRGRDPRGVGNQHELVGRYYMDHPRVVYGQVELARPVHLPKVLGLPLADGKIQLGLGFSEELQRREGLLNSYLSLEVQLSSLVEERYRTGIGLAKVVLRRGHAGRRLDWSAVRSAGVKDMVYLLTPKEIVPHAAYRAYAAARRLVFGKRVRGTLTIINYCEQLPDRKSRVYLSDTRDRLGMPKLVLDWRVGGNERRTIARLHAGLDERIRRAGIGRVRSDASELEKLEFTDASHHMGTTRMSRDPKQGVVDSDCRVHGIANLYVTGSSVFSTCGNANPTWTIVALSLRLAEHLKHHGDAAGGLK